MNKLMGFYELKDMNIPSVPWEEYTGKETLDPECLWSVRSAVFRGNDLNLPRIIGATASQAIAFADDLLTKMRDAGIVIFYPYFLANKSGTLNIFNRSVIIEAVRGDLWNLVTYSDREVTIRIENDEKIMDGNRDFLTETEIGVLLENVPKIKRSFRNDLAEGKSVLLEWSFAQKSGLSKEPLGKEYLVFYEARTVE